MDTHINVTVDFRNWDGDMFDLRIPTEQTIKQLLLSLEQTLSVQKPNVNIYALKVETKNILLADDDLIINYPVTNGDVLVVL